MVDTRFKYVDYSYAEEPLVAFRAGKTGAPGTLVEGGTKASGTITFADNPTADDTITINSTVFTFVASGATGNEINIGGTLPLTLDNIVTVLTNSLDVWVLFGDYTEDGVDELTITYVAETVDGNSFSLAASADTVSGAVLTGGQTPPDDRADFGPTEYVLDQAVDQNFYLSDGDEAQRKFIYISAKSTGDAVLTPDNLTGGTTITFGTAGEYSELRFINGSWVQTAGTATVA